MQVILHDNCEINTFYDSSAEFTDELQFGSTERNLSNKQLS